MPLPDIPTQNDLELLALGAAYGFAAYLLFLITRYAKFAYFGRQIARHTDTDGSIDRELLRDLEWHRGEQPKLFSPVELLKATGWMIAAIIINGIFLPWVMDMMAAGTGLSPFAIIGAIVAATLLWSGFNVWRKGAGDGADDWDLTDWRLQYRGLWLGGGFIAVLIVLFNWR